MFYRDVRLFNCIQSVYEIMNCNVFVDVFTCFLIVFHSQLNCPVINEEVYLLQLN